MCIRSGQHNVTSKSGIGDLSHNVFVGKSDNIAVLWGVVLVLVLSGKTNPGLIVSFPSCAMNIGEYTSEQDSNAQIGSDNT
jgi:hypothetical protein